MIRIALAGNPNCGKTTMFNNLTGSNQYVGNWPGVTVEKKEGKLKGHKEVIITDLPGTYSLSPYTLEEVVSRNYLIQEKPDAIINLVDATNLERNLYLTTQILEIGIPVVLAVNMMDLVQKNGDKIDTKKLSKELGCEVVETSALKGTGSMEAAEKAIAIAQKNTKMSHMPFPTAVENALAEIAGVLGSKVSGERMRWYTVKLFERDEKIQAELKLSDSDKGRIEAAVTAAEEILDDDSESIITNDRYEWIGGIVSKCASKKKRVMTTSDKIDRVVTNRFLALPIFIAVMFIVYYISVTSVGTIATDWANDGVFGDGWHITGAGAYEEAMEEYAVPGAIVEAFEGAAEEQGVDPETATTLTATAVMLDDDGNVEEEIPVDFAAYEEAAAVEEPDPASFGIWVPGIPVFVENFLVSVNAADWLQSLVLDGIIGGVGAVLGFVPQMIVLFLFLSFLEDVGYMARIAFIMDRVFRKFGLSGKSFIPMLISSGCGVPGIMSVKTIENEKDRRMTAITTTFIPCGAKMPIIALFIGAMFGTGMGGWVAPLFYFLGVGAVIICGIILKKTKMFAGEPAPFVMELPQYHLPTVRGILMHVWERARAFIVKAGTIIFIACAIIWFLSNFGWLEGSFGYIGADYMNDSILAAIGNAFAWIFAPLGFYDWRAAVATVTGLVAKENVVGTFGVLFNLGDVSETSRDLWGAFSGMLPTAAQQMSFIAFNLLCAPCFAAIGALNREMNSAKWTAFALTFQTLFAYAVALIIYQLGALFTGGAFGAGTVAAILVLALIVFLLVRPDPYKKRAALNKAASANL